MRAPRRRLVSITGVTAALTAAVLFPVPTGAQTTSSEIFVNEFHYDNTGADADEFIEVTAPADTDLTGWSLVLYNGSVGSAYDTVDLSGTVADAGQGQGFLAVDAAGLQNGSPDGLALIDPAGAVVEFLSYEGSFVATDGPADGLTSTDIGVSEPSSTPVGSSLQRTGTGTVAGDFTWTGPAPATRDAANTGQTFTGGSSGPLPAVLNEFSVSTAGTDQEWYEIAGSPDTDYSSYAVLEIQGIVEGVDTPGQVLDVTPVGSTDATGLALLSLPADTVENDPITLLLVEGFSGAVGDDLDPGDDGQFDTTPWTALTDSVSIQYGAGVPYSPTVLDEAFDDAVYTGASAGFAPGGASRLPDRTGGWVRNDFDLAGLVDPGSPEEGEAANTPGQPNRAVEPVIEPPDLVAIHDVQGSGPAVAISGPVAVEGTVTSLFEADDTLDGFFLQEQDADADADPATSEGIFVFCRGACPAVAVGDAATVAGDAVDYFGMSQIDTTTAVGSISIDSSGNPPPTPVAVSLPAPGPTDDEATFEAVEGMVVAFQGPLVVSEYFELARYGQVVLTTEQRPEQFTDANAPDPAGYAAFQADLASRRIILDDDDNTQNDATSGPQSDEPYPYPVGGLSVSTTFRGGDTIDDLVGVLHWSFAGQSGTDAWRVRPVPEAPPAFTPANPRPASPPDVGGDVTVASFNVLNYFTTLNVPGAVCGPSALGCRGANSDVELARQRAKIAAAMAEIGADVFGLIEIENDDGAAADDLVAAVNTLAGPDTYAALDTGPIGGDAIKVAFLYRPGTVRPVGDPAILDSSFDPRYIDDKNRPALVQTWETVGTGERFTVAVNHFKSKGSACDDVGDPDRLDGQGNCAGTRTDAARVLLEFLATDPTGSGDPDTLIIGDLNSYAMEDPITTLIDGGYTDLVRAFGGDDAYSYVFDGQLGYLDHALANGSMAPQVSGTAVWHVNADEVSLLDYNDEVRDPNEQAFERESAALPLYAPDPYRSSDHDPVLVGLDLGPPAEVLSCGGVTGTVAELEAAGWNVIRGGGFIRGTRGRDFILGSDRADIVLALGGDDVVCGGDGVDLLLGGTGADVLSGDGGDDLLRGGPGRDVCDGGPQRWRDVADRSCETVIGVP